MEASLEGSLGTVGHWWPLPHFQGHEVTFSVLLHLTVEFVWHFSVRRISQQLLIPTWSNMEGGFFCWTLVTLTSFSRSWGHFSCFIIPLTSQYDIHTCIIVYVEPVCRISSNSPRYMYFCQSTPSMSGDLDPIFKVTVEFSDTSV
jgi:hypothetical protein